jgi:Domain of unknown function (DUF4942)/Methionine biosynthesis protein MetW
MNAIALPTTVLDLIEEYQLKQSSLENAIENVSTSVNALHMNCCVQGTFVGSLPSAPSMYVDSLSKNLLKSGWRAAYNRLRIDELASAKDKKLFDQAISDPPPFTIDNIKATFGDYFARPRFHILRGLAEVFTSLDPAYKSHSKVKIGVKGLPKRIILGGWGEYSTGWGVDRFVDLVNALATFQRKPHIDWQDLERLFGRGVYGREIMFCDRGISVWRYLNGNAHVIFNKDTLLDINRALAEFYGDVLPDVEEDGLPRQTSTAVSKDLQFYWSPQEVIDEAIKFAGIYSKADVCGSYRDNWQPSRILEPSCGDGRILDAIRARGHRGFGIEYHAGRAVEAKAKGHAVLTANFLDHPATPEFDYVIMNPPFYGTHYAKHVRHALKFLKPGGTLVAILPATARYDHDELADVMPVSRYNDVWKDLPVASFAEVGTNVPTTMLRIHKPREA